MTKENFLKFVETKTTMGKVYKKIPWQKKLLHAIMIPLILGTISWPALQVALSLEAEPINLTFKIIRFAVFASIGIALMYVLFWIYFRDYAMAVKKSKKYSKFYVDTKTIDYDGHRKWQRKKVFVELGKGGYTSKEDFQGLYDQLGEWMKKERFSLVLYATLYGAIGIPVWAAYLSTVFSNELTFDQNALLFIAFCIISTVLCLGVKMFNELYNSLFTKYKRIAVTREILGNTILRYNAIKVKMKDPKIKKFAA